MFFLSLFRDFVIPLRDSGFPLRYPGIPVFRYPEKIKH